MALTNKQIEDYYKAAKGYAVNQKRPEHADEFAAEVVVNAMTRGDTQPLNFAWIDYLRKELGRTHNSPKGQARAAANASTMSFDAVMLNEYNRGETFADSFTDESAAEPILDKKREPMFTGRLGTIYDMYFKDERPLADCAAVLGVTESRVSQLVRREIRPELERIHLLNTVYDDRIDDPDGFKLVVDWITI